MMKRAVVTGGLGFIGSHLVDRLLQEGIDVNVVDNLSTGKRANLKEHHSSHLKVFTEDVSVSDLDEPFQGADSVFHLAGLADIIPSIENPLRYCQANVLGTYRVLEAARKHEIQKVIYAASSSCYGLPDIFPTPETAPIQPQYPYAFSKWSGEEAIFHWGKVYGMNVISLRLFNVYGPRSRTTGAYGAVFGVFLAQKLAGKPLTIVGDGSQKRDFVYVTDVVDAFYRAATQDVETQVFNVGANCPISVNQLAESIGGPKVTIPKRPSEPDITNADISKIKKALGWKPSVPFEKGVQLMLGKINDWKEAPVWTSESIAVANKDWFRYLSKEGQTKGVKT